MYDLEPFGVFPAAASAGWSFGKAFSFSDSKGTATTPFALDPPLDEPFAVRSDDFERGYGT